jgi:hypothetical protein
MNALSPPTAHNDDVACSKYDYGKFDHLIIPRKKWLQCSSGGSKLVRDLKMERHVSALDLTASQNDLRVGAARIRMRKLCDAVFFGLFHPVP